MSSRAKHARITIKPNRQIEVVLPLGVPKGEADKLVKQQQGWINRTLARMQKQAPLKANDVFPTCIELFAIAEQVQVVYLDEQKKPVVWHQELLQLSVCGNKICVAELLRNWLKKYAKEHLPALLKKVAVDMQVDYRAVSIRLQKARWGSCSVQGNISLNAKLLLLPPYVMRYVLVHELSHLEHMNHSAAFWQHVEQFEPNYRKRRFELRQLSMALPAWVHG